MKSSLTTAACLVALTGAAFAQQSTESVEIVRDGVAKAVIVVQPDASEELTAAVEEMRGLIRQASGADLAISDAPPTGTVAIHVGQTDAVAALKIDSGALDGDGFVIRFPDADTIVILGPTDWGTEFGVYEFLERYVGVRWLMPGPDGTHVPRSPTIRVPREPVRDEPAFFSRKFFGLRLPEQQLWARRNRLHSRVEFHHQLYRLFPHSDVTEHPEFFPMRNGERYLPPKDTHFKRWQPCFTAPGIVDVAVARICTYFEEHPDAESYSFGVTDSGGHCECDRCRKLDAGRKNMIGKDHLSDRYFTWVNAVIERVLERYPDKWFGCLAYSEIFEPPERVNVHPRMIPYMTYDRMQWIDPETRRANEALTRRWAEASPVLGWYDYIYGAAYLVPRVYPHLMAEYYRFGHQNGVRALTAEAYPNFGEGPKLYVSLKLQWDPDRDVDALLDEWYTAAVGAEAAPYVKKYYAHWEDFWTRRILESTWWPRGRQYLPFNQPGYLEDVKQGEIHQCREWLENAVTKAETDPQRKRATLLLSAFEYYEASALAYPRAGPAPVLNSEADAKNWLETQLTDRNYAEKRRHLSTTVFLNHPFLHHCMDIDRYDAISGKDWGAGDIWALFDWVANSRSFRTHVAELAQSGRTGTLAPHFEAMLACLDPQQTCLIDNPSFEEGDGPSADAYSIWLQDSVGNLVRSEQAAQNGAYGMLGTGIQYGGPHQSIEFTPGTYALIASLRIPEGQPEGGFVDLSLRALNEQNHNLPNGSTTSVTPTPGRWHTVATVMDVRQPPKGAVRIRAGVWARNFPADKQLHIDNMRLLRLPE